MYKKEDLMKLDALPFVKSHKEMFLRGGCPVPGLEMAQQVSWDALVYGNGSCEIFRALEWWFIASESDWLKGADGKDEVELFSRLIAAPEFGDNCNRSEIVINAFATDVWIVTPSEYKRIKEREK